MISRIFNLLRSYDDPRYWVKNILWRFPSSARNINVVFVVGAPRSGTTLLQRILSVHSNLFSIQGETGLFSYQNIFDPKRKHFNLNDDKVIEMLYDASDIVDFFSRCVEFLSAHNGGARFVEKTPQHVLRLSFILKYFPCCSVIHIVRDGRDCYCSSRFPDHIPQSKSVNMFARYWKKCVSSPIAFENDRRVFTVKYEAIVNNPRLHVSNIMKFLNLKFEEEQLQISRISEDRRARLAEFSRLVMPINASSVERWRTELTDSQSYEFENIAGKELTYYGYALSSE